MKRKLSALIDKYHQIPVAMKASIAFILASVLTQGFSIITMPIFTRVMSTDEIGLVTIYNSWESLLGIIVGLGLASGSFNIGMMEFSEKRDEYISSILNFSSTAALGFFSIFMIFSTQFKEYINLSSGLFYIMFIGFILMPATNFWILKQRYEYNYKSVVLFSVFTTLSTALLSVFAVLYSKSNNIGYSLGEIRLYAAKSIPYIAALVLYGMFVKKSKVFIKWKYVKFAFKLSIPLLIHSLAKQVLDISDRIMIEKFLGLSEVGIYGVLYTLSTLSLIVWNAINASLIPFMFNKLKAKQNKEIENVITPVLTFYFIFCIFMMLLSPEIVKILTTEAYYGAIYLMPPIATGIFFTSLYNVFSNVLLYYKKTYYIMIATVISAGINIILNYIFIPIYGYIAAAYTTLLAYLILAILQYIFMRKVSENLVVINYKYVWMLSFSIVLFSILISFLYSTTYLRYIIMFLIVIGLFIKRKYILKVLIEFKK